MNVLIACEESQTLCISFRNVGYTAFSCDIQKCSGGFPEWHICGDVLTILNGNCSFKTESGESYSLIGKWDIIIAHPPCTYLSKVSAPSMFPGGNLSQTRYSKMLQARDFFYACYNADCDHICVENPTPLHICELPSPNMVFEPYYFGDPYSKRTCLWLKGLSPLWFTCYEPYHVSYHDIVSGSKLRSKTFPGFASACASQWGSFDFTSGFI